MAKRIAKYWKGVLKSFEAIDEVAGELLGQFRHRSERFAQAGDPRQARDMNERGAAMVLLREHLEAIRKELEPKRPDNRRQ